MGAASPEEGKKMTGGATSLHILSNKDIHGLGRGQEGRKREKESSPSQAERRGFLGGYRFCRVVPKGGRFFLFSPSRLAEGKKKGRRTSKNLGLPRKSPPQVGKKEKIVVISFLRRSKGMEQEKVRKERDLLKRPWASANASIIKGGGRKKGCSTFFDDCVLVQL